MKIFITGVSSGLGLALAKFYVSQGHTVGGCARTTQSMKFTHANLISYKADVSNRDELISAFEQFSPNRDIDVIIANAGVYAAEDDDSERMIEMLRTQILGAFNCLSLAPSYMKSSTRKGYVLTIGSILAPFYYVKSPSYGLSKRCVLDITKSFDTYLNSFEIDSGCFCPAYIQTEKLSELTELRFPKSLFASSEKVAVEQIDKMVKKREKVLFYPRVLYIGLYMINLMPRFLKQFFHRV